MPTSRSPLRWVFWLSVASVAQLLLQFLFQMLLARQFGAAEDMDAYASAMAIPTVIGTILATSLGQSFVPLFIDVRVNSGEAAAWRLASSWGGLLILGLGAVSFCGSLAAETLMTWLQPGFNPREQELTAQLFRVASWLILTNSLVTFLGAVFQCLQRFGPPPLAILAGVVFTLVWTVIWTPAWGIMAATTGVLGGSIVTIVILAALIWRHWTWRITFDEALRRSFGLWAPLTVGVAYCNLGPIIDRYLASDLPPGNISHLAYASRVTMALLALSTYSLATVMFPTLAHHKSSSGVDAQFATATIRSIRFLIFILMPLAVALVCFNQPLIHDLFQRGRFDAQDTIAVGHLVALYVGMLVGLSLVEFTARAFFALHDARTPVMVGIASFTLGIVLKIILCKTDGLPGIVVATSLHYLLNAGMLLWLLSRRFQHFPKREAALGMLRSLAASLTAAAAAWVVLQVTFPFSALIAAGVGAVVYVVSASLFGDEFGHSLFSAIIRKVRAYASPA